MPAADQTGNAIRQDGSYRIGRILSQVFHPTLNGFASFLLVGAVAPEIASVQQGLSWAGICIVTIIIPPALYFYLRLFFGAYSDDDVSRRSERTGLYLVALLSTVIGSAVLYQVGLPRVFLRLLVAAVAVTLTCMLVNFRWKISVHSASIATLSTLATIFLHWAGALLWICAVAVGWARIRTGNHTPLQVLAGWGVAIVGVILAFEIGS